MPLYPYKTELRSEAPMTVKLTNREAAEVDFAANTLGLSRSKLLRITALGLAQELRDLKARRP